MERVSNNQALKDRTVLVSSSSASTELAIELERSGARVITAPEARVQEPESYVALDEAIENLFGYDWIIFANVHAVDYFLRRFDQLNHDIDELDDLRVCAIDETSRTRLEEVQVHVDLIPDGHAASKVIDALEAYLGGREAFRAANFLIPRSTASDDPLPQVLEDAGARVDVVAAYRIASTNDSHLAQLRALLVGGGIDYVAFASPSDVATLAHLLDTADLSRPLQDVVVACIDQPMQQAAHEFGLSAAVVPPESSITALVEAIQSFQNRER
jgi:uroporphyrinogen III methyltransferase/synthase